MKVIAIVKEYERVLCELTTDELAHFAGRTYCSADIDVLDPNHQLTSKPARKVVSGDQVAIDSIFDDARKITEAYDEMKKFLSQVKASITKYENIAKP